VRGRRGHVRASGGAGAVVSSRGYCHAKGGRAVQHPPIATVERNQPYVLRRSGLLAGGRPVYYLCPRRLASPQVRLKNREKSGPRPQQQLRDVLRLGPAVLGLPEPGRGVRGCCSRGSGLGDGGASSALVLSQVSSIASQSAPSLPTRRPRPGALTVCPPRLPRPPPLGAPSSPSLRAARVQVGNTPPLVTKRY